MCVCGGGVCLVAQSWPTLCHRMYCSPPGSSVHGDSPGKNAGVGCYAFLQGIFPTLGSNPGLPHCRQILYYLSHQGSPSNIDRSLQISLFPFPDPHLLYPSLKTAPIKETNGLQVAISNDQLSILLLLYVGKIILPIL